jgi:hypothetical protein
MITRSSVWTSCSGFITDHLDDFTSFRHVVLIPDARGLAPRLRSQERNITVLVTFRPGRSSSGHEENTERSLGVARGHRHRTSCGLIDPWRAHAQAKVPMSPAANLFVFGVILADR